MAEVVVVKLFVDVLAALYQGQLAGNVFGFDSNRPYGSSGQGGDRTATVVHPGDQLLWSSLSLECEAFVDIVAIRVPGAAATVRQFQGSQFWSTRVPPLAGPTHYRVSLELGHIGRRLDLETLSLLPASGV